MCGSNNSGDFVRLLHFRFCDDDTNQNIKNLLHRMPDTRPQNELINCCRELIIEKNERKELFYSCK